MLKTTYLIPFWQKFNILQFSLFNYELEAYNHIFLS